MNLKILKKSFKGIPIVKRGDYPYVIHPITDGVPFIEPKLLKEVTNEMARRIEKKLPVDRIVTMEAMGIPIATALSIKMNIPFTIIRKRSYRLPNEVSVEQITGYSRSSMFINGLNKGEKIVIVDDVLSTGGTLRAVIQALKTMGIEVKGVFIAINKGIALDKIREEFNIDIDALVDIDVINDKIVIKNI